MQGTRPAIGSLVALSLLVLPATALGQTSERVAVDTNTPVYLTWEGALDYGFSVGVPAEVHDWGERDHDGLRITFKASDPRVSGEQTAVYSGDSSSAERGDLGRGTALVRIENADGAWQGPVTVVDLPDYMTIENGWLTGEGAYEGLSFFYSYHDDTASDVHTGEGSRSGPANRRRSRMRRSSTPTPWTDVLDGASVPSRAGAPSYSTEAPARPWSRATRAASVRVETPSLPRMLLTWTPAVDSLMKSPSAISRLVRPAATSASTSRSRRVRP